MILKFLVFLMSLPISMLVLSIACFNYDELPGIVGKFIESKSLYHSIMIREDVIFDNDHN